MSQKVRVRIGEIRIGAAPDILICSGLGSCLGVALYDPEVRIGGLAHVLLPGDAGEETRLRPGKYAVSAVPMLLERLADAGADRARLFARLVGGATMFPGLSERASIGERNIAVARGQLELHGIPLVAEDVGANYGRSCELHLADGRLLLRTSRGRDRIRQL
ncbi:MAG: chemotaxis protein CheD [Geothermobacteraceae bacterium]